MHNSSSEITSVAPPSPAPAVSYTYNANGNVTARTNLAGTQTYA